MAEIITKDSEEFKELTGWMKKIGKSVEAATARIRPAIADEHYLQGEDVCEMLHISKRTLQTLRDEGAIPYTTIGGKDIRSHAISLTAGWYRLDSVLENGCRGGCSAAVCIGQTLPLELPSGT